MTEFPSALWAQWLARYPVPQGPPGAAIEEACRQWCVRWAEQCVFSVPSGGFGMKRAGEGRPLSKDTLAQDHGAGRLYCYDLISGAGTGQGTANTSPSRQDITGQIFVPVSGVDRLGTAPPPPEPPASGDVQAQIDALKQRVGVLEARFRGVGTAAIGAPPL